MNEYEQAEQDIEEQLENGEITQKEYWEQLRALQRDYTESAEEAARDAYDREMDRWW